MERILIEVHGLPEAQAALAAVKAFRTGARLTATTDGGSGLADRLHIALTEKPLPEGARILLQALVGAPASQWVTIDELGNALVSAGYASQEDAWGKARAALAGISWAVNDKLHDEVIEAKGALNLVVRRQLFKGKTRYRLTEPGRTAAQRVLQP